VIVHAKSLNSLIVLNDRVKSFFFQSLPISAKLIFVVGIEKKQKVLDVRNHFLKPEVALGTEKVIGLFL
jgi:hypothetical protein